MEKDTGTISDNIQERLQVAAKGKKRHVVLPVRLPIQGKEEMQFYLYLVWKEIFATVTWAL